MANTTRPQTPSRVVVIGLGRFGSSLARELARRGYEILGIDADPRRVQVLADDLTHAVVADTTDEDALRQLDVPDFERAVVGIGSNLEASILTTSLLVDFGIPSIWAKALNHQQARILERVGAHHVVLPEHDMGERVAHLVTGRMLDFIAFDDDYAIIKRSPRAKPPACRSARASCAASTASPWSASSERAKASPTRPPRPSSNEATY